MSPEFLIEMGWKSAAICGVALVGLRALRSRAPDDRATLLRVAVLLLLLLPAISLAPSAIEVETRLAGEVRQPVAMVEASVDAALPAPPRGAFAPAAPRRELPVDLILGLAYATGVLALGAWLLAGLATLRRWTRLAEPVTDPLWLAALDRATAAAGVRRRVRLLLSDIAGSPLSWGYRSPAILLDRGSLARVGDADAILAHEVAHVARTDWPALLLARVTVAIFWFNPLVWLLQRALVEQAEEAADRRAVERLEPTRYAEALVTCFRHAGGIAVPANSIAARGLTHRVSAVLDGTKRSRRPGSAWTAAAILAALGVSAPVAAVKLVPAVQPAPSPAPVDPVAPLPAPAARVALAAPAAAVALLAPIAPAAPVVPETPPAPEAPEAPAVAVTPVAPVTPPLPVRLAAIQQTIADATARAAEATAAARIGAAAAAKVELIDPDTLIEMRIHGVTGDYAEAMARTGGRRFAAEELIELRIMGVRPETVRGFAEAGYRNLDSEALTELAVHGVTPAYARDLAAAGLSGLTPDNLVEMRIHGVSASGVRRALTNGRRPSVDRLVEMAIHGEL